MHFAPTFRSLDTRCWYFTYHNVKGPRSCRGSPNFCEHQIYPLRLQTKQELSYKPCVLAGRRRQSIVPLTVSLCARTPCEHAKQTMLFSHGGSTQAGARTPVATVTQYVRRRRETTGRPLRHVFPYCRIWPFRSLFS